MGADSNDTVYTLVDTMADGGKTAMNSDELVADDDAERSVASVEDQLRKEMTVYEVCLSGDVRMCDIAMVLKLGFELGLDC